MSNDFYVPGSQKGVFGNLTAWVFAAVALIVAVAVTIAIVRWVTAPAKGRVQARQQIQSGSFRIAAYDSFFNACASIQGVEGQLDAQLEEEKTATGDDLARVQANIAGLKGARAQAVAQYNADARKGYTVGQFRASDLPYQLSTDPYIEGAHTSCVA